MSLMSHHKAGSVMFKDMAAVQQNPTCFEQTLQKDAVFADTITSVAHTKGFPAVKVRHIRSGASVFDIVSSQVPRGLFASLEVSIVSKSDRFLVPISEWQNTRPPAGSFVEVAMVPQGDGNKILRTVLIIGAIVAAVYTGAWLANAGFLSGVISGAAAQATFTSVAATVLGTLINVLVPPKGPRADAAEDSVDGSGNINNKLSPGGVAPVVFGDVRFYPPGAALPFMRSRGKHRYQYALLTLGPGPIRIDPDEIKMGGQYLKDFDVGEIEIREGWQDDEPVSLISNDYTIDPGVKGIVIDPGAGKKVTVTTAENTSELELEFGFLQGLVRYRKGKRKLHSVNVNIRYRRANSGDAFHNYNEAVTVHDDNQNLEMRTATIDGFNYHTQVRSYTQTFTGRTALPTYFSRVLRFPEPAQYEIELERITPAPADDAQIQDKITLMEMRSQHPSNLLNVKGHAFVAIKMRTTDQKAGGLSNISVRAQRYYPYHNGRRWVWPEETRASGGNMNMHLNSNPAHALAWAVLGPTSKRPIPEIAMHTDSILTFRDQCNAAHIYTGLAKYEYNRVIESARPMRDVLHEIARAGRARLSSPNGQLAVVMDQVQTDPKGIFTPRNISKLSGNLAFAPQPHAIAVSYLDEEKDFKPSQVIAYNDGYHEGNAIQVEKLDAVGVTANWRAWLYGKYYLENMKRRAEVISFTASIDALHNSVGDFVLVKYDVPKAYEGDPHEIADDHPGARILEVIRDGANRISQLRLDEALVMKAGEQYSCAIRTSDTGQLVQILPVGTNTEVSDILHLETPVNSNAIQVDDLVAFGRRDRVAREMVITDIRPLNDMSAQVTVVDLANDIHTIDNDPLPVFPEAISTINDPTIEPPDPVVSLSVTENLELEDGVEIIRRRVNWKTNPDSNVQADHFDVYGYDDGELDDDGGIQRPVHRYFGTTKELSLPILDEWDVGDEKTFTVVAVSAGGTRLTYHQSASISYTAVMTTDNAHLLNSKANSFNLLFGYDVEAGTSYGVNYSNYLTSVEIPLLQAIPLSIGNLASGDDVSFAATISADHDLGYEVQLIMHFDGTAHQLTSDWQDASNTRVNVSGIIPDGATDVSVFYKVRGQGSTTVHIQKYALNTGLSVVPFSPPIDITATKGADGSNLQAGTGVNLLQNSKFQSRLMPWKKHYASHNTFNHGITGIDYLNIPGVIFASDGNNVGITEPSLCCASRVSL